MRYFMSPHGSTMVVREDGRIETFYDTGAPLMQKVLSPENAERWIDHWLRNGREITEREWLDLIGGRGPLLNSSGKIVGEMPTVCVRRFVANNGKRLIIDGMIWSKFSPDGCITGQEAFKTEEERHRCIDWWLSEGAEVSLDEWMTRRHPPTPTKVGVNDTFGAQIGFPHGSVVVTKKVVEGTIEDGGKTDPAMERFWHDRLMRARTLDLPLIEDSTRHVVQVAKYQSERLRKCELFTMALIENDMARGRSGEKVALNKGTYDLLTKKETAPTEK
jgi:hypothetical protein